MSFRLAKSWKERGKQLQIVKDKCEDILGKINLHKKDARAQGMIHVRQFCNTLAWVPIILQGRAEKPENVPILLSILGVKKTGELQSMLKDLNKNAKAAFITMTQFALENCVNRVLGAIPGEKACRTFCKSSKRLLEVTKIPSPKAKHDLLMVPAWIRNTLHANGNYSGKDKTVTIGSEAYQFRDSKRFACASWSHLFFALLHALSVYEEILLSRKVRNIKRIKAL